MLNRVKKKISAEIESAPQSVQDANKECQRLFDASLSAEEQSPEYIEAAKKFNALSEQCGLSHRKAV